jgi:stage III sporulation protein AE
MKNKYKGKIFLKIIFISIICIQIHMPIKAYADENPDQSQVIDEQIKSNEISKLDDELSKHGDADSSEIIKGYDPQKIIGDISNGKFEFNIPSMLNNILKYFFKEIYVNIDILIKLIILVILCAILKNLQTTFLSDSVGELAFFVCYIVMVTILIISFNTALKLAVGTIDSMVSFMYATIPVMITLLISGGNVTSAGIFQPVLMMIVEVAATIIKNVFIPLIFLSTILNIVDNISDKIQVSKLAGLLKQISGWSLGLILTLFIAILTLQGSLGAVVDGVTGKTAKYAIGAFIPVVGKYLADAADAVIGCTLLIKNAAGIAVMIGIVVICLVPLIKIFALIALYKMTCAIIEPIAEKRITNCINDIANSLTFLLGIVTSVAFMFLISITAMISASNLSAMIR